MHLLPEGRQGRSGLIARAQTIAGSAPVTSVTGAELFLCVCIYVSPCFVWLSDTRNVR